MCVCVCACVCACGGTDRELRLIVCVGGSEDTGTAATRGANETVGNTGESAGDVGGDVETTRGEAPADKGSLSGDCERELNELCEPRCCG